METTHKKINTIVKHALIALYGGAGVGSFAGMTGSIIGAFVFVIIMIWADLIERKRKKKYVKQN